MTNEEREWAIRGWAETFDWVMDRYQAKSIDEGIEALIEVYPEFANAPLWLSQGVSALYEAGGAYGFQRIDSVK